MIKISKYSLPLFITVLAVVVIAYSVALRVYGLGYSDLQGDEINTINYLYSPDKNFIEYLLEQKKGPIQFVINYINTSLFGYVSEGQVRFPYLLAGIVSIFALYKFVKKVDGKNTALISALLLASSGLFISFSRITQYQSVMYLLLFVFLFLFVKSFESSARFKLLVISAFLYGLMILNHYDALSVMPFILTYFLMKVRNDTTTFAVNIRKLTVFMIIVLGVTLSFYIPFLLHSEFSDSTSGYLSARLLGGGFMPRTEITLKLISMYIPKFWLYLMFFSSLAGIIVMHFNKIKGYKFLNITFSDKLIKTIFLILVCLLGFAVVFSLYPIKPRTSGLIFLIASFGIIKALFLATKSSSAKISLTVWYLASFWFYLFFVRDPRTHVYIAFLPGFIHAAIFYVWLLKHKLSFVRYLAVTIFSLVFLYLSYFNWMIYVDRTPEYPWWNKTILERPMYKISQSNRIDGVFGFNSNRGWSDISKLFKEQCLQGTYESNEKDNISTFYVGYPQLMGDKWIRESGADNLIVVDGPQSWIYESHREFGGYNLLTTLYNDDMPVTFIYGKKDKYPTGKLLCE